MVAAHLEVVLDDRPIRAGDLVEIVPDAPPPAGQPAPPKRHGLVEAVDAATGRATVRVQGRRYPLEVPLRQLRRRT